MLITELPSEVLFHMFTFLKGTDLALLRLINTTFRDVISLDTVWLDKCYQGYGINSLEGWKLSTFYELYTKVLHRYGFLLGLWQAVMMPYGTMIYVQHEKGKLVGSEMMAPNPPKINKALRKKLMFTVEFNEENIAETICHMGPNRLSHACNILPEDNEKDRLLFKCCVEAAHRNPGGMRREFEQFMMDESYEMEDGVFMGKIEILQKFRVLKKYEACFGMNRIILPAEEPDAYIQTGLYKADYDIFGYEIILVYYSDDKSKIIGKKVTGDLRVPEGQIAFEGDMNNPIFLLAEHQCSLATIEQRGYDDLPKGIHFKHLPEQDFLLPQDCAYEGKSPRTCAFRFHATMNVSPVDENEASFLPSHLIVFNRKSFALLAFKAEMLYTFVRVEETFL